MICCSEKQESRQNSLRTGWTWSTTIGGIIPIFFFVAIVNRNIAILGWTAEFGLTIFHIILFCYREVEQAVEDLDG